MATRLRSARGEGEQLRTALLDAASELLAESQSVDQLSVRAITARAGVSPTAMYLHFGSKEELTEAVKRRCFEALEKVLREAEAEHEGDSRAQLRAMGHAYLRFAREQPGEYAVLFQTYIPKKDGQRHRPAGEDGAGMKVFEIIVAAVGRCLEDNSDAFEIACLAWMNLHGRGAVSSAMPTFPFPDEERYVALVVDRCVGAPRMTE